MQNDPPVPGSNEDSANPWRNPFLVIWTAALLFLYATGAWLGAGLLHSYGTEAERVRQLRIAASTVGTEVPAPDPGMAPAAAPVDVLAGVSVNRVGDITVKQSGWTAAFTLWFRWTGDAVSPGESFRVANGEILEKEKLRRVEVGELRYEEYHVVARITKPFDVSRFPVADEGFYVEIQDGAHSANAMRYVADDHNSSISAEALQGGATLKRFLVSVKTRIHTSRTPEPDGRDGGKQVSSVFIFAMLVSTTALGIYQKMFQALFASVAIALLAMYIKPIHLDPRFGLPVGAFFASVSNNASLVELLPVVNRLTLTDMVNAASLFTIFLVLVQSAISLYLFDTMGREQLARSFDRASFVAILAGYLAVNLALPLAARLS